MNETIKQLCLTFRSSCEGKSCNLVDSCIRNDPSSANLDKKRSRIFAAVAIFDCHGRGGSKRSFEDSERISSCARKKFNMDSGIFISNLYSQNDLLKGST